MTRNGDAFRGRRQHEEALAKYLLAPKSCGYCKCVLPYEARYNTFCSHGCSAHFSNQKRGDQRKGSCVECHVTIRSELKYCKPCLAKKNSLESAKTDATRKAKLILERGHRCEVCQLDSWNGKPIPIELDHVDGNSDHNDRANLRLLCPNCHAQTPTYKVGGRSSVGRRTVLRRKNGPIV